MSHVKSPFFVIENLISPKLCEEIITKVGVKSPNLDAAEKPIKLERFDDLAEQVIFTSLQHHKPAIEERYGATIVGTEELVFQHFPENPKVPAKQPGCESSSFVRKKWVKHRNVDLTGYVWLKDYQDKVPLDPRIEVYGGKLEFPAYNFSFTPQRGTCILFPAGPHFITAISPILVGELYQVKINMVLTKNGLPFLYQPTDFPGTWQQWLMSYF